jgi:hypothetical protein
MSGAGMAGGGRTERGTPGRRYYADATLGDFIRDLWAARLYLLAAGLAGLLLALVFLGLAVPHTRAAMLVGPVSATAAANGAAQGHPVFDRFEATLRGPHVAARIFGDERLLAGLRADRRWRFGATRSLADAADVAAYLEKHVEIMPVGASALRRVRYAHPDPALAVALLAALAAAADEAIRADAQAQVADDKIHLQQSLARTQNPEHRRHLTDRLMTTEETAMMLAQDKPFAAVVAEAPAAEAAPHWPRPAVVVPVLTLMGLFFGFALFNLRRAV